MILVYLCWWYLFTCCADNVYLLCWWYLFTCCADDVCLLVVLMMFVYLLCWWYLFTCCADDTCLLVVLITFVICCADDTCLLVVLMTFVYLLCRRRFWTETVMTSCSVQRDGSTLLTWLTLMYVQLTKQYVLVSFPDPIPHFIWKPGNGLVKRLNSVTWQLCDVLLNFWHDMILYSPQYVQGMLSWPHSQSPFLAIMQAWEYKRMIIHVVTFM